jgi:hypothetical protein
VPARAELVVAQVVDQDHQKIRLLRHAIFPSVFLLCVR